MSLTLSEICPSTSRCCCMNWSTVLEKPSASARPCSIKLDRAETSEAPLTTACHELKYLVTSELRPLVDGSLTVASTCDSVSAWACQFDCDAIWLRYW